MLWGERRHYQLTPAELAAAYRIDFVDRLRRPLPLLAVTLILLLTAVSCWVAADRTSVAIAIAAALVLVLYWAYRFTFGMRFAARKALRSQPVLVAPHDLIFGEDALTMQNEAGHSSFRWQSFYKLRVHRDFVLLFTTHLLFVPVPRRAFENGDVEALAARMASAGVRVGGHGKTARHTPRSSSP